MVGWVGDLEGGPVLGGWFCLWRVLLSRIFPVRVCLPDITTLPAHYHPPGSLSPSRFEQIRPPATESPVNLLSKGPKKLQKPAREHKQHHVRISCNHRLSLEFLKRYQGGIDTPSHAVPSRLRKKFANPKTSDTSSYVKR